MTTRHRTRAAAIIRPFGFEDMSWAEVLIGGEMSGRHQARRGELIDVLALAGLVAEVDGRPVGLLTHDVVGRDCEIAYIEVEGDRRRLGVGTALLDALSDRVSSGSIGADRVWLVTTNDNVDALRFYQRRGFVLKVLRPGAVTEARRHLKAQIPKVGSYGIELRDELELERVFTHTASTL